MGKRLGGWFRERRVCLSPGDCFEMLRVMLSKIFVLIGLTFAFQVISAPVPNMPRMAMYQFVMLRAGTNSNQPTPEVQAKLQQEHLDGLIKLNREKVNLLFGPFTDNGDLRGIVVLDVPDAEAARKVLADDPYLKAGLMTLEIKPWLCETNHFFPPEIPHTPENLVLGFLMSGTNRVQLPAEEGQKIQSGHLAYMGELHKQGKLLIAGPFGDNSNRRGLVIYHVKTVAEAQELAAGDPAVKAGRLAIDARPWTTFKGILK